MSEDSNIEISKKGLVIRWHYIWIILGSVLASNVIPHFLPNLYVERTRSQIEAQLDLLNEKLKICEQDTAEQREVNHFIMKQFGLDKMTPPAPDTTRRR